MERLEKIMSVCPECFKEGNINKIQGEIIEEKGKVWIVKICKKHGPIKDIYFGDVNLYRRWMKYGVDGKVNPNVKTKFFDDPQLYDQHLSQPVLTNLLVTNRCNLRCSYCFMNAGKVGYVYEPDFEQIKKLVLQGIKSGSKALQITGGEPTMRNDLEDIINYARSIGYAHVQVNTNGMDCARDIEYCRQIRRAGTNTVYMSFDGVSKETNPWIEENKKAVENFRKVNQMLVLVPVLSGKNIHEAGKIVRYAFDNIDTIRGVNFQPISFCGRLAEISEEQRKEQRTDYVAMMEQLEKEFDGQISREDFYPVPFVFPISEIVEVLRKEIKVEFTAHPGCGGATYIFKKKDGGLLPITRFVDVEGLMDFIHKQAQKKGKFKKARIASAFLQKANGFVDRKKAPEGFNLRRMLIKISLTGNYDSLREFHHKSIFIGSMWFQDTFNFNIDRLERCVIQYTTEEGMVPFCSYNSLDYGEKIREKYSVSKEEWEKRTGRKIKDDLLRPKQNL